MSLRSGSFTGAALGLAILLAIGTCACDMSSRSSDVPPNPAIANIQVSHQTSFPDHAEPALAVNPHNPQNLLGTAQFFNMPGWRPILGTFSSFDGGRTWQDNGPLPMPPGYTFSYDVTVAFTADGSGFVAGVAENAQPAASGVFVWRTDDGGRSFGGAVAVTSGGHGADHPWLAVDTLDGPHQNALYVAWSDTATRQLLFSRSADRGRSFTAPLVLSDTGAPPIVTVGPAGSVQVFFGFTSAQVVSSLDGGQSFGPPLTILSQGASRSLPPNLNSLLAAASDPHDGTLYIALATSPSGAQHLDITLWRSHDGGHTWSAPVSVTNDPLAGHADYFQPQLVVSPTGTVFVSYLAVNQGHIDVFLSQSTTHGANFQPSRRMTAVSFTPAEDLKSQNRHDLKGSSTGIPWIGDYQGLAVGPDAAYPLWTDTHTGQMEIFTALAPIAGG